MNKTLQDRVLNRVRRSRPGRVVTARDLRDLGGRDAIDQALSRLARQGTLQRVGRGLYSYPRMNKQLGILVPPDVDDIADAIARQTGSRIAPSGAAAANRLGLSTQVPAKPVYLTNGRSRKVKVGNYVVVMKHVSAKKLPAGNRTTATVVQALQHVGRDRVNASVLDRIRRALPARSRATLAKDASCDSDWLADAVRRIAHEDAVSGDG